MFGDKLRQQIEIMENAWRRGDFEELQTCAHWLKGAAGTLGFDDFTEPAEKLEKYISAETKEQVGQSVEYIRTLVAAVVLPEGETMHPEPSPAAERDIPDSDFFSFSGEEIMDPDGSYFEHIERRYADSLRTDQIQ